MNPSIVSQLELLEVGQCGADAPLVLKIDGDVCYENAHEVVEAVHSSLSGARDKIILEVGDVKMIDSSGLKALLQSHRLCRKAGIGFELQSVSDYVARVIHMSGFQDIFGLGLKEPASRRCRPVMDLSSQLVGWKTFEHTADSEASMISVLRERISEVAIEAGARDEMLCDIKIAIGEALTNAYKHGSPNKGVDKIRVRCTVTPKALVVEIHDQGTPFDPDAVSEPTPAQLRDHGMGIYLMRQTMDLVEFSTDCPGNRVRMVKWLYRE